MTFSIETSITNSALGIIVSCGRDFNLWTRDGFGSDTHGYEFGRHYLPHFISNLDTNTNIIEYEYKTDISNSDLHSNTYSIYNIES
jgi:hypothetical protein